VYDLTDFADSTKYSVSVKLTEAENPRLTTIKNMIGDRSDISDGTSFYNIFMSGEQNISKSSPLNKALLVDFMKLFRDYALVNDNLTRTTYEDYLTAFLVVSSSAKGEKVRTIADLKRLESQGFYDPKRDIMRLYGYNPAPVKTFLYVSNGAAGRQYAMTYLNKFLGAAFSIQADIIGRPEILLNRPHYFKKKDCIGLLTQYSMQYTYGSSFSTHIVLNYIRKNSSTYEYSLHNIDTLPINSDKKNQNSLFSQRAARYYKYLRNIKIAQNVAGTVNQTFGNVASPSAVNSVIGKVASKLVSNEMGLHTFNDDIGHLDFDKRDRRG
jgi:hypothetical protein